MWAKPRVYFCHSFPRFVTHFLDTLYTRDNAHRVFNSGKKKGATYLRFHSIPQNRRWRQVGQEFFLWHAFIIQDVWN